MATSLVHDVTAYCNNAGSTVFLCSLDAEGAFDCIPHGVLFDCASSIPNNHWRLMYYWYSNMCIHIRWRGQLGHQISVQRGTRQGGLTSPLLFNLFYQTLIEKLSECNTGVIINNITYNIFCYADDLLLASTSVSGLQTLIDIASSYVTDRGLRFNPTKTVCTIKGENPFICEPKWYVNNVPVQNEDHVKYLGSYIGKSNGQLHAQMRASNANKAFYSLQGAGLYKDCLSPETALHIYNTAVRSSMLYGCASMYMNKTSLNVLDKAQAKHIKTVLGLSYYTHTTPLLQATRIESISNSVLSYSMDLLRSNILSCSASSKFYCFLLTKKSHCVSKTLVERVRSYALDNDINIMKYIFNNSYRNATKNRLVSCLPPGQSGIVDSVRSLLYTHKYDKGNRVQLNNLLMAF
jgi:hypothetical protein